jgi:hypothetical protein
MATRVLLFLAVLLTSACDQSVVQPIPFPKRAYLGETVSVAIDTDSAHVGAKHFTLSSKNVRIQLWDTVTEATHDVVPRAVITSTTALGTTASEQDGATELTVVVFDLPTTLPLGFNSPPTSLWIYPVFFPSGAAINTSVSPIIEILGPASEGDGPTTFYPGLPEFSPAIEKRLEPLPALRLRARRPQFLPSWTIGSIEFEISYPSAVSNPRAYSKITAARALAFATTIGPGRARVVLVDPIGFKLNAITGSTTVLGAGPFIDLVFDQAAPFSASGFDIENLVVTTVDGTVLIDDPGNSEEFFELYFRANQ